MKKGNRKHKKEELKKDTRYMKKGKRKHKKENLK